MELFSNIADKPIEGTIYGSNLTNIQTLQAGAGSRVMRADEDGLWLGAEKFVDAPFKVDMSGNLIASSVTLSGYIAVGGALADVGAGNITGTYIADGTITTAKLQANIITANEIATNAVTSAKILANAVTADKISVSTLSAISANVGTVTAGSLSGITIAIGSGNSIFKADSNGIYLGNATFGSAPFRVNMSGDVTASSITLTNASVGSGSSYTGNQIAEAYIGNLNASKITAGTISADRIGSASITTAKLASGLTLSGTVIISDVGYVGNGLKIGGGAASVAGLQLAGTYGHRMYFNEGVDKLEMHDDLTIEGDTYIGSGSMSFENGKVLTMSSNKTAIVPTSVGYRALYCMESPEVWFMDIVSKKDKLDPVFEEVTVGKQHFIKTEDGQYLVFARRKGHEYKRFEEKTEEEFLKNEKFLQMAKI